jgi:hypothetical protein
VQVERQLTVYGFCGEGERNIERQRRELAKASIFHVKLDLAQCRMPPVAQVFQPEFFYAAC